MKLQNKNQVSIKMVGIGYYCETKIGESHLEINVLNIWDSKPDGIFIFKKDGKEYYLQHLTKITDTSYKTAYIKPIDVTVDIENQLTERGYTF